MQSNAKNKNGNFFEPVGDFVGAVEGFLQKLLRNPSDNASKDVEQKKGQKKEYGEPKYQQDNKKPSNILQDIIDIICCGSRDNRSR